MRALPFQSHSSRSHCRDRLTAGHIESTAAEQPKELTLVFCVSGLEVNIPTRQLTAEPAWLQGDIESTAAKQPKELTAMFEAISGSEALRRDYEGAQAEVEVAEGKLNLIASRKRAIGQEKRQKKEQKEEAERHLALREELVRHLDISLNPKSLNPCALKSRRRRRRRPSATWPCGRNWFAAYC